MRRFLLRGGRVVWHTTVGGLLLVAGVVMLVTPGPGIVTIILGLAVLAREYDWADRAKHAVLSRIRDASTHARAKLASRRAQRGGTIRAIDDLPDLAHDAGPAPTGGTPPPADEDVRNAS